MTGTAPPLAAGGPGGAMVPPHNHEAEMALLAAVLADNRAYERVADILRPEHFADDAHGRIYDAAAGLIERGRLANPVTLKNAFERDGALKDVGGAKYLARLAGAVVTLVNAEEYGRTIRDLYLRRRLIGWARELAEDAGAVDPARPAVRKNRRLS